MREVASTSIRPFDYQHDLAAVKRIWREVGWVDADTEAAMDDFFAVGQTMVATVDDTPECAVQIADGTLRVQHVDVPLSAVTAVTTSRVARGYGFARRLTALQLQQAAHGGAAIAALGMFDQGFYDQLGFGNGAYDHEFVIDPGDLTVTHRVPAPRRLTRDDSEQMHRAMCARHRVNGSVSLEAARLLRAELGFYEDGFGLGYYDQQELTHFIWLTGSEEHGPYQVRWLGYRNGQQLLELLGVLKSLADQIYSVRLMEPPEIDLQSLLRRPFRQRDISQKSQHAAEHSSFCWWQARILDIAQCVAALRIETEPVEFALTLHDPVQKLLAREPGWQGVAGSYVVRLGRNSSAQPGHDPSLPQLECSVNAFTRYVIGAASASTLGITGQFQASDALLQALEQAVTWPPPRPGWEF